MHHRFDQISQLKAAGGLGQVGARGSAILAETVADDAAGGGERPLAVLEVAPLGKPLAPVLAGGGQDVVHGPYPARALGLRERRRRVGLAGTERLER